jgi:PUA domain protein
MPQKHRRYALKTKEAKQILNQASERLKLSLEALGDAKASVETVETDFGRLLLMGGKPLLFESEGKLLPTLLADEIIAQLPRVVVDMGAIPHVCNGADIMAPGIVRFEGAFSKGDVVLVVDVKHGKPLAVGEILFDADSAKDVKKGAVVKNVHYVGDQIWNFAKTLTD